MGLAAEMAYNLLLALVPALIFMIALFGLIGRQVDVLPRVYSVVKHFAPEDAVALIQQATYTIVEGSSSGLAFISILGSLWAASNAAMIVIKGLSRAFDISPEHQPFWRQRLIAFGIVIALGFMLILGGNLLVLGDVALQSIQQLWQLNAYESLILNGIRWTLILSITIAFSAFVYGMGVGPVLKRHHWKDAVPGALVFISIWVGVSWLFSLYIENMGRFNHVYGSLGVVVILMTWFYLSSLALFIGGEVNALLAASHSPQQEIP